MKRYEQMTKRSYLLTSPETYQQEPGNGSSNMASDTHTGKNIAAILKKTSDSFSLSESQQTSQLEGLSKVKKLVAIQRYDPTLDLYYTVYEPEESGTVTETLTRQPTSSEKQRQAIVLSLLKTLYQHIK